MPAMQARSGGLAEDVNFSNSQLRDTGSVNWSFFDLAELVPGLENSFQIVGSP
ncbi:MAG: hypothetical protein PVF80_14010 [Gammaproteobacteria bacterium]